MTGDYCSKSEEGGGAREAAPSHAHMHCYSAHVQKGKDDATDEMELMELGERRSERRREKDGAARGRGKLSRVSSEASRPHQVLHQS